MAAASILDADMATLGSWIRTGFTWWQAELYAMIPDRLRRRSGLAKRYVTYHGDAGFTLHDQGVVTQIQPGETVGTGVPLTIDSPLCLVRELRLPLLGESDLRKLVALDADRIMPLPGSSLLLAINVTGQSGGQSIVQVAGLPRSTATRMLELLAAQGTTPSRIGLNDGAHDFDFTSAFKDAGLLGASGSVAARWWAMVAFLFVLNSGILILRDIQHVDRLSALVEAQAPAVNAARTIARRIDTSQRSAQQLVLRREQQDVLQLLAAITAILPPKSWVQRFQWDGRVVRLTGYKREGIDVIGALRKSPILVDVRAANSDVVAEVPTGQPFDVTATVRRGKI